MDTVAADTSYYQVPLDRSYPHKWWMGRISDGSWIDPLFQANYATAKAMVAESRLAGFTFYVVFRPGQAVATADAVRAALKGAPHPKLSLELDLESWDGQITGNHSTEIIQLRAMLASVLANNLARVGRYGNRGDLSMLQPSPPPGIVTRVAAYTSQRIPGYPAQQYTDGSDRWPVPAGLPRSSQPFGRCDHNVFWGRSPVQVAALYGTPYAPVETPSTTKPTPIPAAVSQEADVFVRFINSGPKNNNYAVYLVSGGTLIYIDALTYGWLGKPPVHNMDLRSNFWKLPVVPGTSDFRGK
jgi:hypothetical protein